MDIVELAKQIKSGKYTEHLQKDFSAEVAARLAEMSEDELKKRLDSSHQSFRRDEPRASRIVLHILLVQYLRNARATAQYECL